MTRIILLIGSLCLSYSLWSQTNPSPNQGKRITIENADLQEIDIGQDTSIQSLIGNVRCYHDGAFFFAERAVIQGLNLKAYNEVVLYQNDSTVLYADSIFYNGETHMAYLYGKIIMINGQEALYTTDLTYNTELKLATFENKALIKTSGFELKSQSGWYDNFNKKAKFEGFVSAENEDLRLVNDTLDYDIKEKRFSWTLPTIIFQDSSTLYSELGYYDYDDEEGLFMGTPVISSPNELIRGDTIYLNNKSEDVKISGNARYTTNTDTATADIIITNKNSGDAELIGNASFKGEGSDAKGEKIIYNKESKDIKIEGGGTISDAPNIINALFIDYNKKNKAGILIGNVEWIDTAANTSIKCDTMIVRGEEDYYKAIGTSSRPMLAQFNEDDTLYIVADTLSGYREIVALDSLTSDTIKYLVATNEVELLSNAYQARSQRMIYNQMDSIINLTQNPYIWQDTSQINGDSIKIFMQNKKIKTIHVASKSMMINTKDFIFYNQMAGNTIDLDFEDGEMYQIKVNEDAKSVYYLKDDEEAYIGVNTTTCKFFIVDIVDGSVDKIRHYIQIPSKILPMLDTDHEALKLEGFLWLWSQRPIELDKLRIWSTNRLTLR